MIRVSRRALARILAVALVASLLVPGSADAARSHRAAVDPPVVRGEGVRSALVHVADGASWNAGLTAARRAGARIGTPYRAIDVFVAYGSSGVFKRLARSASVEYLEANRRVRYFTETSHTATRGQDVLDGTVTLADGTRIDGRGVGVAVVDSGVDGTHPDLEDRMGGNVKMVCSAPQPVGIGATGGFTECLGPKTAVSLQDTDTTSAGGHGTHVAGTVAGTGAASQTRFHGAAPGATLYGVSSGDGLLMENALDGLAWVLENHDKVSPAIKVVNNSWGSGHAKYEPETSPFYKATWKLQEALVAAGVTVVFAAGNSGGDGKKATTSAQCVNPTPGVICVANFDDGNRGTRDGALSPSSSRGAADDPATWPDLSAPGTNIVSTCRLTLPVCNAHFGMVLNPPNSYSSLSGTSMAAPHVAGIAAQLLQADPALAPGQVEDVLEDTAYKFAFGSAYGVLADPFNEDDSSSFDKGHGLADVVAAVQVVLGTNADPDPTPEETETSSPSPTPEPSTSEAPPANDPFFERQWALRSIHVPQAWEQESATGSGIKVAVLGGGIDATHEDLQCPDKLDLGPGSEFGGPDGLQDTSGHGTLMTGIIGACAGNGKGIAGVAPESTIVPFAIGRDRATVPDAIRAAADAGAHIIDVVDSVPSLGELPGFEGSGTRTAVEYANSTGALVIAGSGGLFGGVCGDPAELDTVLCIGSVDSRDLLGWDAALPVKQRGPALVAPGGQQLFLCREHSEVVLSTFPTTLGPSCMEEGGYRYVTGSGAAAAHVAGVAALVYDRLGGARTVAARAEVLDALLSTAIDLGTPGPDPVFGSGKVNALRAVTAVTPPPPPEPETTTIAFAPDSAESGQFSDEATIAATLVDSSGAPMSGKTVDFSLVTSESSKEWSAITDPTGTARQTIVLDLAPGAAQLTVAYPGDDTTFSGSADTMVFVIDKEDSSLTLKLSGKGRDKAMDAHLTESDSGSGLAEKTLEFLIDGRSIGTGSTDGSGSASIPIPAKLRNGHHVYEVVFDGDRHYTRSTAKIET